MKEMLYLASRSPRRRALLRELGWSFQVVRSSHREVIRQREPPSTNVMRNAIAKTRHARLPHGARGIVIGADTVLYFRRQVIGKPQTRRAARRLLTELSGRSHWVYTGLCLRDAASGRLCASYEKTNVTFKLLDPNAMTRLLDRMRPLDKAGGYAIQRDRGALIAHIEGSRSNVIGLPLERLRRELAQFSARRR